MRGSLFIEKTLEVLRNQAESSADLFEALTTPSRSEFGRKKARILGLGPKRFKTNWAESFRDRQQFYSLLDHLKREGLVESKRKERSSTWKITPRGRAKLKEMVLRNLYANVSAKYDEAAPASSLKIITYDIPTSEKQGKRAWLRWALKNLGFKPLQKSVWLGKRKIPARFLEDLRHRRMLPYIHIIEVANAGTLRKLT